MMDLNGHEAGNGGHSQGKSKVHRVSSTRQIVHRCEADVVEVSGRQYPAATAICEVVPTRRGLQPRACSTGMAQEPKRAPHLLSHQEDRLRKWVGRYATPRVDRRKHGRIDRKSVVQGRNGKRRTG